MTQAELHDIRTIPGVCEVTFTAPRPGAPTLLIELPHGATRTADYEALRSRLAGSLPDNLEAFFYVNTDIGTPESAAWLVEALAGEGYGALVLRCLVPRTFIDCNRVVAGSVQGAVIDGLTPAVAAYIEVAEDRALLEGLHREYHALVERAYVAICGAGGLALQLHSYAPRSVGIDRIDGEIVAALRRAYEPAVYATWPERPAVDIICAGTDGTMWAAPELVAVLGAPQRRVHGVDVGGDGAVLPLDGEQVAVHPDGIPGHRPDAAGEHPRHRVEGEPARLADHLSLRVQCSDLVREPRPPTSQRRQPAGELIRVLVATARRERGHGQNGIYESLTSNQVSD